MEGIATAKLRGKRCASSIKEPPVPVSVRLVSKFLDGKQAIIRPQGLRQGSPAALLLRPRRFRLQDMFSARGAA